MKWKSAPRSGQQVRVSNDLSEYCHVIKLVLNWRHSARSGSLRFMGQIRRFRWILGSRSSHSLQPDGNGQASPCGLDHADSQPEAESAPTSSRYIEIPVSDGKRYPVAIP